MTDTLEQRISKAIFDGMLPSQGKVRVKILAPRIARALEAAINAASSTPIASAENYMANGVDAFIADLSEE